MVKALYERVGEERGEPVVRDAVRRYGEERGRRMAYRAKANGHALSMDDYIVYGEIETARGAMEQKLSLSKEGITVKITRCPWCTVWREEGLAEWGRLYCREIDSSIVRGFNPELELDVKGTMSNGSSCCAFIFRDAGNMLKIAWRKAVRPGRSALRPWDFHVGHLFATMENVFVQKLGKEGAQAAKVGAAEFERRFGEAALQRLLKTTSAIHIYGS